MTTVLSLLAGVIVVLRPSAPRTGRAHRRRRVEHRGVGGRPPCAEPGRLPASPAARARGRRL